MSRMGVACRKLAVGAPVRSPARQGVGVPPPRRHRNLFEQSPSTSSTLVHRHGGDGVATSGQDVHGLEHRAFRRLSNARWPGGQKDGSGPPARFSPLRPTARGHILDKRGRPPSRAHTGPGNGAQLRHPLGIDPRARSTGGYDLLAPRKRVRYRRSFSMSTATRPRRAEAWTNRPFPM